MGSQLGEKLTRYLESLEASNHPILSRMEQAAKNEGFPIIGPQCGRVLMTMALAVSAKRVFEMGSGFGYSTLWFATAVGEGGEVIHTDDDTKNTERAKDLLAEAGLAERCRFLNGDAVKLLSEEEGEFDCILIDIDKQQYPSALPVAVEKLRIGGILMAHNAIWSGRVADEAKDPDTEAIRRYDREIMSHPELVSFINPVHDGLAISLKVPSELRRGLPL